MSTSGASMTDIAIRVENLSKQYRITEPTEGYAEIHRRVGSLLEVGSGLNPELIGQENPGKGFICNLDKDS